MKSAQTIERPEVLAVEDDGRIRRLIETVLESEGYNVISASNGKEALEILDSARPSVILLDLMLPGLDGWALLRRIRDRGLDVPVVLVSAIRDLPVEARKLGTDSLPKPFAIEELVSKVEKHLGGARRRPRHRRPPEPAVE